MGPQNKALAFARHSLAAYTIAQAETYQVATHHRAIARKLEAVERGEIKRLMIFMPPRHGKSMLASHFFPAWYLGRNPSRYVIATTYAQEFANDNGRKVLDQLKDPLHRAIFPECALRIDSKAVGRFQTAQGGVYFGVGAGGPITGRGAHLLLIDDPLKGREQAESELMRRRLKDWYSSVAYTRLMPGGAVVVIQTRWHEDDLAGWLLSEHAHEAWDVLSLPAINDQGMALWPDAYPVETLKQIKLSVGSRDWASLYQQRPTAQEGGIVKLAWFKRYGTPQAVYKRIVQSWDTANKPGQLNDPSVCTTWGETETGYDLLDVYRERLEYPDLKRKAIALAAKWSPDAILIEDKSSGQSLLQDLRRETNLPVIAIEPVSDKVTRMATASPLVESGRVGLPNSAPWLIDYEAEITTFPNAAHDDQVDSTSQFLNWVRHPGAKPLPVDLGTLDFGAQSSGWNF